MIKEISLKGITTTPDDYLCEEGTLAYAQDLISQDNSLLTPPVPILQETLQSGETLLYIHHLSNGQQNYIIYKDSKLYFLPSGYTTRTLTQIGTATDTFSPMPTQITAVGNSLCIVSGKDSPIRYAVFKDSTYTLLPAAFPVPVFETYLQGDTEIMRPENTIRISKKAKRYDDKNYLVGNSFNGTIQHGMNTSRVVLEKSDSSSFNAGTYHIYLTPDSPYRNENWNNNGGLNGLDLYVIGAYYDSNGTAQIMNTGISDGSLIWNRTDKLDTRGNALLPNCWRLRTSITISESFKKIELIIKVLDIGRDYPWKASFDLYDASISDLSEFVVVNNSTYDSFNSVSAAAKQFIDTYSLSPKRFIYPFFVKVAFKTQDNQYISPSAPVLLIPNTGQVPMVRITNVTTEEDDASMLLSAFVADLYFKMSNQTEYSQWTDIISKVVIAISEPIYSYNQGIEKESDLKAQLYIDSRAATNGSRFSVVNKNGNIRKYSEYELFHAKNSTQYDYYLHLPQYPSIDDKLNDQKDFFVIKEIPFKEIINNSWNTSKQIKFDNLEFSSLANQISLPDDASSLNQYYPDNVYVTNGRLHIGNYKQTIFSGWNLNTMYTTEQYEVYTYRAIVTIKQDNNTYNVETAFTNSDNKGNIRYFAYPNINAISAKIIRYDAINNKYAYINIPLKTHKYRNEAYWFNDYISIKETYTNWTSLEKDDSPLLPAYADRSTYIKISEPNNPLIFTNLRTYAFDSQIKAMSSAVTALSQGQAGDFDLYIFTANTGIWSLKINSEGGYNKQIPVTRDTITNINSLTQLDGSVIYATSRGLMELKGSVSTCISSVLDREETISLVDQDLAFLSLLLKDVSNLGLYNANWTDSKGKKIGNGINPKPLDFKTYLQTAYIVYDYRNQRIIVFNNNSSNLYPYCYSYNLRTSTWTLLTNPYCYKVNSYPDALIVDTSSKLLNISGDTRIGNTNSQDAFLLTRPLSLDTPNEYKTIDQLRINGTGLFSHIFERNNDLDHSIKQDATGKDIQVAKSHVQTMLYASNDLQDWFLVSSSDTGRISGKSGTPYRFFRLAIAAKLLPLETIDSISFSFRIKDQNSKLF